ncbi:lipoprotein [Streptomyces sodiiphilus]|uniref:Lipoprotein n=1 Tax=Streptomyces sodiiphilus TaxID=226217 RepID=A0ABN2PAM3_9ACTN
MRPIRKGALAVATAALLIGTAACSGDSGSSDDAGSSGNGGAASRSAFEALQAAAEKTQEITSADIEMVVRAPGSAGGDMTMTGSMSWEPTLAMDITATGPDLNEDGISMIFLDNVMYMNLGEEMAAETGGASWLKMDFAAIAEESGDDEIADALTHGMGEQQQSPQEQLALLLESSGVEHMGQETLNGEKVDRYSGTVTLEEALEGSGEGVLDEAERTELIETLREQGIESFDIDVWVDGNDFPVQIHQAFETPEGKMVTETAYSNYGTSVTVEAPPEDETIDFMEMMAGLAGDFEDEGWDEDWDE